LIRQIERTRLGAATNIRAKAMTTTRRSSGMPVSMTMGLAPFVGSEVDQSCVERGAGSEAEEDQRRGEEQCLGERPDRARDVSLTAALDRRHDPARIADRPRQLAP
jgi:hypothetical protein